MNNGKVVAIVDCIEEDLRALAKETGEDHISCFILNGYFHLSSFTNKDGQEKLSFYRNGEKE